MNEHLRRVTMSIEVVVHMNEVGQLRNDWEASVDVMIQSLNRMDCRSTTVTWDEHRSGARPFLDELREEADQ